MDKKIADQPNSPIVPPPGEDPEEQGLRVLARIIAKRLVAKNGYCKVGEGSPEQLDPRSEDLDLGGAS